MKQSPSPSSKWKPILALAVAGLAIGAVAYFDVASRLRELLAWIEGLGALAPLAYFILYVLACIFFVPGFILTVGAGFVFGALEGSVYASISSVSGATAAFLVGRYFARDWVAHRIEGNESFRAIDQAVAREGWKIVGLIRLSPLIPFNLLNYALSLTKVRLSHFTFASWIGMLPGTVVYVYIGSLAGDLATLGGGSSRSPLEWALYVVGLLATIAVTLYVTRLARKALRERVAEEM